MLANHSDLHSKTKPIILDTDDVQAKAKVQRRVIFLRMCLRSPEIQNEQYECLTYCGITESTSM